MLSFMSLPLDGGDRQGEVRKRSTHEGRKIERPLSVKADDEIFSVGKKYLVKKSFMSGADYFVAGEVISYEMGGYVPYDDAVAYQFHSETDGRTKLWWRPRIWAEVGKPEADWSNFFDPLNP